MATTVWPSQGTTLAVQEVASNNTFSLINNITSLTDSGSVTVTQQKTSSLVSQVHTYRETIADMGEPAVDIWYDPTDTVHIFVRDAARNAFSQNGPYTWKQTYSAVANANNATQTFSANVSEWKGGNTGDVEDNLSASFTLKITGADTPSPI